jgi:putative transposase
MTEKGYSQRRACALVGIDPRVYRYRSTRGGDETLRRRLHELSAERRRFGYRRLHILLRREGWEVNWKKLYRIYREERLTVRRRGGRRSRRARTSAGASTSCPTRYPADGGSGCCA